MFVLEQPIHDESTQRHNIIIVIHVNDLAVDDFKADSQPQWIEMQQ